MNEPVKAGGGAGCETRSDKDFSIPSKHHAPMFCSLRVLRFSRNAFLFFFVIFSLNWNRIFFTSSKKNFVLSLLFVETRDSKDGLLAAGGLLGCRSPQV